MREIGGDTRRIDYIVEGELVDHWAGFEQKRQWL